MEKKSYTGGCGGPSGDHEWRGTWGALGDHCRLVTGEEGCGRTGGGVSWPAGYVCVLGGGWDKACIQVQTKGRRLRSALPPI